MPHATSSDGARIFYTVIGSGPPLLMAHGVTHTWQSWQDLGYVDALKNEYRLILLDLRGHGESDKPHDPISYRMSLQVDDVLAVLAALGIERAHFWGYSLGAIIGFHLAASHPERLGAFVAHGAHPYPASSAERAWADGIIDTFRRGMAAWVAELEQKGILDQYPDPEGRRARLLASDPDALVATEIAIRDDPSIAAQVPALEIPCLVLIGERDPGYDQARRAAAALPNAEIVAMPGTGHALGNASRVLPFVRPFLDPVRHSQASASGALAAIGERDE